MAISREALLAWSFPDVVQRFGPNETILYALGLGLGADPTDPDELRFVYEENLRALPSMGVVLGFPGFWLQDPATGADWKRIVHGEQGIEIFRPLPATGTFVGRTRVTEVIDKGPGKGALLFSERDILLADTGERVCRVTATTFLRGDGGFGGPSGPTPAPHAVPSRAPDASVVSATLPQAALIYRLSGDYNPLHADPDVARSAGFERPILHGLCTFGVASYALVRAAAGNDPDRLRTVDARFSSPVLPGETIETDIWREPDGIVSFRSRVGDRVVLSNGRATLFD